VVLQDLVRQHPRIPEHAIVLGTTPSNLGNAMRNPRQPAASLAWYTQAIATLEPVVATQPQNRNARASLRNAHRGYPTALTPLSRHGEALPHWDRTIELDDGQYHPWFCRQRALTLARLKEH